MADISAMEIDKIVGQNLRALRLAAGWTQRDVGRALGVTFQQVQKYEKGNNRLSLPTLLALREFFDVPLGALLRGLPPLLTGFNSPNALGGIDGTLEKLQVKLSLIPDAATLGKIARITDIVAFNR